MDLSRLMLQRWEIPIIVLVAVVAGLPAGPFPLVFFVYANSAS